jgi:predicted outer membrane lipoprotein
MEFPPKFQTASPADKLCIVELGLQCWTIAEKEAFNFSCLDETILRVQKDAQTKIENLQLQLEMQESMIRKQLQEEKRIAIREATLEERQKAQEQIVEIRQKVQEQVLDIRVEAAALKAKIEVLQIESEKKDILLSTKNQSQPNQSSQALGKIGEKEVEKLLQEFVNGDITNVATESHGSDFRISIGNTAGNSIFLLDSKNFKTPIPKKDREKLVRDIDEDSTVSGGILVSLNSIISTKNHFEIDKTEKKKPLLFICLKDMDFQESGRCLAAAFRILTAISTTHDEEEKDDLLKKIQNQVRELNLRIREITNIITAQNKQIDTLVSLKENLKKNLFTLQDSEEIDILQKPKKRRSNKVHQVSEEIHH